MSMDDEFYDQRETICAAAGDTHSQASFETINDFSTERGEGRYVNWELGDMPQHAAPRPTAY